MSFATQNPCALQVVDPEHDKTKARWIISPPALYLLEQVFKMEHFPSLHMRHRLATDLGVSARQVQVWFQNRRQRDRNLARAAAQGTPLAVNDKTSLASGTISTADDDVLPPLPPAGQLDKLPAGYETCLRTGRGELVDEGGRCSSPSPSSVDAILHQSESRHVGGSSVSSPPMSPTSQEHEETCNNANETNAPAFAALPVAPAPGAGALMSASSMVPADAEGGNGLEMPIAAALPNVAEYFSHMERHQRAYAMQLMKTPQEFNQCDTLDPRSFVSSTNHAAACGHIHASSLQGFGPPSMSAACGAASEMSVYDAAAARWPHAVNSMPPPGAPLMPSAAAPTPADAVMAATDTATRSPSQSAPGPLPFAHALPMPAAPAPCAGAMPPSLSSVPGGVGSVQRPAAAAVGDEARSLAAPMAAFCGTPAPSGGGPGKPPSDPASLSMYYAALASHYAQVAQVAHPASGALPPQAPAAAAAPSVPAAPAPPAVSTQGFSCAPTAAPSWWQQAPPPAAPLRFPAIPTTEPVVPSSNPSNNMMAMRSLALLQECHKRRVESTLHGNAHSLASYLQAADVAGVRSSASPFSSLDLPASKQPRLDAQGTNLLDMKQQVEAPLAPVPVPAPLYKGSFATSQHMTPSQATSHAGGTSQMSDEEVFSMFADELQQLERDRDGTSTVVHHDHPQRVDPMMV